MKRLLALLAALFIGAPAFGQSVSYNPPWTARHLPYIVAPGVLGDAGTAADSPTSTIGATGQICSNSARQSSGAWNSLCLQANSSSPATISLQNYGTATAQNLQFVINGVPVTIPTGGSTFIFGNAPFVTGDVPCFLNTAGLVQDCGFNITNGTVNIGTWHGTVIDIPFGGTNATTAAGARTNLGLGSMALQNSSAVAVTGGTITGMPTPSAASDVAIKSYVDSTASGLIILPQSSLATAAVLPNSPTYSNGTAGVGATLTAGSNTTLTVDGTVAALNTVVLVKNQASAFQNGIYTVTTAGGGAPWVLTRVTYFDQAAEMKAGSYTFITAGSANTNSSWTLQTAVSTVGTDPLVFNQFSSSSNSVLSLGGLTGVVGLGNGLTTSGSNIVNNITAGAGVAITGTNPLTIAATEASATVTGTNTTYTSAQASTVVNRSNSAAAMSDTLPGTSPGVLPAGTVVTVSNVDTSAILSIRPGSGAMLKTSTTATGFSYLCPGQTASFYSDGSNYWAINFPSRCVLKAATTIFVAASGSNANDGLTASTPLADASFAWTLVGNNFDLAGITPTAITISLAAGTYPQMTLTGSLVGSVLSRNTNNVLLQGDTVTPANVKIADTGSVGFAAVQVYNAAVTITGFQITSTNNSDIIADFNSDVVFQNLDFHGVRSGLNHVISEYGSRVSVAGNYTISSGAGCHWIAGNGGSIETTGAVTPTITLTGTIAWASGFACSQYVSNIVVQGPLTFSGSATGPRFRALLNGIINSNQVTCTGFPGNSAGTTSTGGQCS